MRFEEKVEEELDSINKRLSLIEKTLKSKRDSFSFDDFVQELIGAVVLALPFAANSDLWEISKEMTYFHVFLLFSVVVAGIFLFIKYSNFGNWEIQNVAGFLPLRLITSLFISLFVSAVVMIVLGIYPFIINNLSWFFKMVVLTSIFSVIGSLGFDAAK